MPTASMQDSFFKQHCRYLSESMLSTLCQIVLNATFFADALQFLA